MKILVSILIFLFYVQNIDAQIFRGEISAPDSTSLPYVTISLKSNPYVYTYSDSRGRFAIDLSGIATKRKDALLFTFVGSRSVVLPLKDLGDEFIELIMYPRPIELEQVTITSRKLSRRERKAIHESMFDRFLAQLEVDFPERESDYNIISKLSLSGGDTLLLSNDLVAQMKEIIPSNVDSLESYTFTNCRSIDFVNSSFASDLEKYIETARADTIPTRREIRKGIEPSNQIVDMFSAPTDAAQSEVLPQILSVHSAMWGLSNNLRRFVSGTQSSSYSFAMIDGQWVLNYYDKISFLGIVKAVTEVQYFLNNETYSVQRVVGSIVAELHIPFGYKLDPEAISVLNLLSIGIPDFEKFRLRHAYIDAKTSIDFTELADLKYVENKSGELLINAISTKKDSLNWLIKSSAVASPINEE